MVEDRNLRLRDVLSRLACGLAAIFILLVGFGIARGGYFLYSYPDRLGYTMPLWKSALILLLLGSAVAAPTFAAYKLVRYSF
jgi:hypothetical protein